MRAAQRANSALDGWMEDGWMDGWKRETRALNDYCPEAREGGLQLIDRHYYLESGKINKAWFHFDLEKHISEDSTIGKLLKYS